MTKTTDCLPPQHSDNFKFFFYGEKIGPNKELIQEEQKSESSVVDSEENVENNKETIVNEPVQKPGDYFSSAMDEEKSYFKETPKSRAAK